MVFDGRDFFSLGGHASAQGRQVVLVADRLEGGDAIGGRPWREQRVDRGGLGGWRLPDGPGGRRRLTAHRGERAQQQEPSFRHGFLSCVASAYPFVAHQQPAPVKAPDADAPCGHGHTQQNASNGYFSRRIPFKCNLAPGWVLAC